MLLAVLALSALLAPQRPSVQVDEARARELYVSTRPRRSLLGL